MVKNETFNADLLSIVAHDLKTPISAVRGYIELVEQSGELNERQKQYSDKAMLGLERMEKLIAAVLDMTRLESDLQMRFTDCDIRAMIQSSVDMIETLAVKRNITIHTDIHPALTSLRADPQWLAQVMSNLLSNAIKYNRDGGQIWVTALNQADSIQVNVRDTGAGILPDEQGQIFDRFFRSRANARLQIEGTGLGLAIAKAIIQKHSGRIWLESVPGQGTTFSFVLPRGRRMSEGHDQMFELSPVAGEGEEIEYISRPELSTEETDAVDDNLQEASGASEADSSSDNV